MADEWYKVDAREIPSPALLVYPERVEQNIRAMLHIAGGPDRVRPHIKTHKTSEIVRMHGEHGITKVKCATLAEARAAAAAGAKDVLVAFQPVGPAPRRLLGLSKEFPGTKFSTIIDDEQVLRALEAAFESSENPLDVFLDIDCGMHRTGTPLEKAGQIYKAIAGAKGIQAAGLHAYDGHIHESDPAKRAELCYDAFVPVERLRSDLLKAGFRVPTVVAGGTPTFPIHAQKADRECSPGTYVFWDFGYADTMPDLPFELAAVLLTRVVSKPQLNLLCLDLGHKAVAAENPQPRAKFIGIPDARAVTHSEEHLVIETNSAADFQTGDVIYAVPRHICPTVALYNSVLPIRNGQWTGEQWKMARERL
jgi:D-serine deaminase-like pyridoxal phosphate-dependent protein